jgi:hypothetical protein
MNESETLEAASGASPSSSVSTRQRVLLWLSPVLGSLALIMAVLVMVWQWQAGAGTANAIDSLRVEQEALQASLAGLDTSISRREAYAEELTARIEQLSTRLTAVDVSDADNAVVGLQRILIRQERDYRDFLASLKRSMMSLDRMIPRSGGWWTEFETEMEGSLALSEARENYLFNLRE